MVQGERGSSAVRAGGTEGGCLLRRETRAASWWWWYKWRRGEKEISAGCVLQADVAPVDAGLHTSRGQDSDRGERGGLRRGRAGGHCVQPWEADGGGRMLMRTQR